jgi:hypothetical protein
LTEHTHQIRGRHIDQNDLNTIRGVAATHWNKGRSAISRILCEQWDWYQANGQLKDRACRVMLLALEKKGEIILPPRLKESYRHPKKADRREYIIDSSEMIGTVSGFGSLTIKMVRRTPDEGLWDFLVDRHHYLGTPWIVGSYLKYLVYLDDRLVACLGWGSAAWKIAERDRTIGWNSQTREANLHKVVNNVRFLILPWINIRHLASKVLALNTRTLQKDWLAFYNQSVSLLETFVDTTRFKGTCYKAANWSYVGNTKGRGKYDRHNKQAEPVKAVYLYPLSRHFREELCG